MINTPSDSNIAFEKCFQEIDRINAQVSKITRYGVTDKEMRNEKIFVEVLKILSNIVNYMVKETDYEDNQ